jgi:transposase
MMGQLPAAQNALFYDFCLERHIPPNHLLRHIGQFLDFDSIRLHLEPFYSSTGRPSIDPELMIRMLLVGFCYGIRSERRLYDEVSFNLAYRWFCRIGLEDDVPDHSTFSKNRHARYRDSDLFHYVFDTVVEKCMGGGLVKGEGFAIDASFIRADVSRQRTVRSDEPMDWGPSSTQARAVREYFEALDENPALRRTQKSLSLTDPVAQWTAAKGPAVFSYSTNYIVDVEHGVIMDVEASPSTTQTEVQTTRTMIDRIESRHHVKPLRLMGDTAYGAAANLGYLVDEKDMYRCPNGKPLRSSGRVNKDSTIRYRASKMDCEICPLKQRCCPNTPARKIPRSIYEQARGKARDIYKSTRYKKSFDERKVATAQNLRKMARLRAQPPPAVG